MIGYDVEPDLAQLRSDINKYRAVVTGEKSLHVFGRLVNDATQGTAHAVSIIEHLEDPGVPLSEFMHRVYGPFMEETMQYLGIMPVSLAWERIVSVGQQGSTWDR